MVQNLALNILLTVFIVVITVPPVYFFIFTLKIKAKANIRFCETFLCSVASAIYLK